MAFSKTAHGPLPVGSSRSPVWRSRALDRSLEEPRARSVARMERLVAAARALANESGSATFTVAQVAERAGSSLKAFYRCFGSKDELLLALFEDDSNLGAGIVRDRVAAHGEPAARLQAYVVGLFEMLTNEDARGYAGVLVREYRRLHEERADELDIALAPLVDLLVDEIRAASAAGACRSTDPARDARTVFVLVLAGIHEVTLGRERPLDAADHIWSFVWTGLAGFAEHDEGVHS
jgi:AcrR family transcriptional regulator